MPVTTQQKQSSKPYYLPVVMTVAVLLFTACGSDESGAATAVQDSNINNNIGSIYNTSCISCHAGGNAAAPRAHDVAAWQPKLAKGIEVLLANVKSGFGAMPPKGMCYDCDDEQLRALINYMAAPK